MKSLKTKLVLAISLLVIILFGVASFLFLMEKQRELTEDIFVNARSFAELTAVDIAAQYELYLPQESFVYFNREIRDVFQKFSDLASIRVTRFNGELVYDSITEMEKQYTGTMRTVSEPVFLEQIQSRNLSVRTLDTDRVVYFKKTADGVFAPVDHNELPIEGLAPDEKISYLVQPANDQYAVVYSVSYAHLQERVNETFMRGLLLGILGVGVGILLAYFFAIRITKPLHLLTQGAGVIAKGNFAYRVQVTTKDELLTLANAFNSMAKDLEVSTKALVYKERVAKELELAAKIQKELLPKTIPVMKNLDIAAGLLPAEEIGGDCYDFIAVDDNNVLMYLGDVTGHGVSAGIIVSIANALIFNYAGKSSLKDLLIEVNKILKEKTSSNMFITLVLLHWDDLAGNLKYVSAGHEQMVHYHAKDGKVTLTPAGGLALGMVKDVSTVLKEEELKMESGDTLVIYSDGIPEAWKNEKETYGMARLKRAVSEYSDLPNALAIRNAILSDVKEFAKGWKQMDDITCMVLKKL